MNLYIWSLLIVVAPPLLLIGVLRFFMPLPMMKAAAAIALIGIPVALLLPWLALRFSVERSSEETTFSGGLGYSATVQNASLESPETFPTAASLGDRRPVLRTNGIGLPGLAVGRFQLANGSSGILFVHDADEPVVVLPASRPAGAVVIVNERLLSREP